MTYGRECFDKDERLAALRIGADVLQDRYPSTQCDVTVIVGINRRDAHASWRWPGVVCVSVRNTGQLIAQSLPGRPYQLDPKAVL